MVDRSDEQRRRDYEGLWAKALSKSHEILGEEDFQEVKKFNTVEQLLAEVQKLEERNVDTFVHRLLRNVRPHLQRLQFLVTFLVLSIGSNMISYASVWGGTYLLLRVRDYTERRFKAALTLNTKLATTTEDGLEEISTYLRRLGDGLQILQIYQEKMNLDPDIVGELFDILVQLLLDSAAAIKHFRKYDGKTSQGNWSSVRLKFTKTLETLTSRLDQLRRIIEAQSLGQINQGVGSMLVTDAGSVPNSVVSLPYYQLPFAKNPNFYGRDKLLDDIDTVLCSPQAARGIRSVAIWGTGGIGKSQVALEYASKQVNTGCQLVLWLPSETPSEISRAIVDAAAHVKPPGYDEGDSPDKIRLEMWNWLQITDVSWLVIFDNVESNDLLLRNWPKTGNGQILVTCRSELLAQSPAAEALEVPPFEIKEASELLLRLARKRNADGTERDAAEKISEYLGGLALGLEITASQILVRKKSMQDFLPYFIENKSLLRTPPRYAPGNPYYSKNLATVWQTAFDSLSDSARKLLSVLAFLAPDGIPRPLINCQAKVDGVWDALLSNYDEAEGELYFSSLIRINDETNYLSVHRLTQEAFYYHISDHERHEAFDATYHLLARAFPSRAYGRHMYRHWSECEKLIHHVDAAQEKYGSLKAEGYDLQDPIFATLMADATWYCGECSALQTGERIGRRAVANCRDKNSLQFAYLCESVATVEHRRGRYVLAFDSFTQALKIRQASSNTTQQVLADSHSAVGLTLQGLYRHQEAIEKVNEAIAIVEAAPPDERSTFNYDRYLRNRARPRVSLGLYDLATQDIAEAEAFQTAVYGPMNHFNGETAYIKGTIAQKLDRLDEAVRYFKIAFDLQSPGKPTHQSVAAAKYRQALVHLRKLGDQAENERRALDCLNHALQISEFNESRRGDAGEQARIKLRMAEVFRRRGAIAEAAGYEAAAKTTKLELEQTGFYPTAPDEAQSWDCFSDLLDR